MTLEEALEYLATNLKDGWKVEIEAENGYAGLELFDNRGRSRWQPNVIDDGTFDDQVIRCCNLSHGP